MFYPDNRTPDNTKECDSVPANEQPTTSKKVLIIDDDAELLEMMQQVLEEAGFAVEARTVVRDIRATVLDEQPDLLILDVVLKNSNGLNAISILKADPDTAALPILLCTGAPSLALINKDVIARADGLLSKPFDITKLVAEVQRLIAKDAAISV